MAPAAALPASLAALNKAAVAAAREGDHARALGLLDELFERARAAHLSHPELHVAHSNRAAALLALGRCAEALGDARRCVELVADAAARAGLGGPARHAHWPKACLRLGGALAGLGQHKGAAAAFEAGLAADPACAALAAGLQAAQRGVTADLLAGRGLDRRALPAPPVAARIAAAPHNVPRAALTGGGGAAAPGVAPAAALLAPGQRFAVGWAPPAAGALRAAQGGGDAAAAPVVPGAAPGQLPRVLLTPAVAAADPALCEVFEVVQTQARRAQAAHVPGRAARSALSPGQGLADASRACRRRLAPQCHVLGPKRYLHRELPDGPRLAAWAAATAAAVREVRASDRPCSNPHLAAACGAVLSASGVPGCAFNVVTTHPATLALGCDLPRAANCLVADLIDDAILSGGLLPAVGHALDALLCRDGEPVLVPASLTVLAQAVAAAPSRPRVAVGARRVRLDLTAIDRHRRGGTAARARAGDGGGCARPAWRRPARRRAGHRRRPPPANPAPFRVWHLPMRAAAADRSAAASLDVELTTSGEWCGVAAWAEVKLHGDINYTTAGPWQAPPQPPGAPPPSHQPALCWFEGSVPVAAGEVHPLLASHNTVRLAFGLREADYSMLFAAEPSFPHAQFGMAADGARLAAYAAGLEAAMARAAAAKLAQHAPHGPAAEGRAAGGGGDGGEGGAGRGHREAVEVTVLDVGCGSGALSLLAVAAAAAAGDAPGGAPLRARVVAAELVAPLAAAALRNAASHGAAADVSVVHADAAALERGRDLPHAGADVVVFDVFDAGLVGHSVLAVLEAIKARLLSDGGQLVPASASLYAQGIEVATRLPPGAGDLLGGAGVDLSALEQFRWSGEAEPVLLAHLPHTALTRPAKVFDFDFASPPGSPYPTEAEVQLEVTAAGRLNAVALWFDLHLAPGVSLTSAPPGFTTGGRAAEPSAGAAGAGCAGGTAATAAAGSAPGRATAAGDGEEPAGCTAIILHPTAARGASSTPAPAAEAAAVDTRVADGAEDGLELEEGPDGGAAHRHWGQSLHYLDATPDVAPGGGAHAGALGLDAAVLGALSQELAMREALSAAAGGGVRLSAAAAPEAAGTAPPLVALEQRVQRGSFMMAGQRPASPARSPPASPGRAKGRVSAGARAARQRAASRLLPWMLALAGCSAAALLSANRYLQAVHVLDSPIGANLDVPPLNIRVHVSDERLLRLVVEQCTKEEATAIWLDRRGEVVVQDAVNATQCPPLDVMLPASHRAPGPCTDAALYVLHAGGRIVPAPPGGGGPMSDPCGPRTARLFAGPFLYESFFSDHPAVLHLLLVDPPSLYAADAALHRRMAAFLCRTPACVDLMRRHALKRGYRGHVWLVGHTSSDPSVDVPPGAAAHTAPSVLHVKGGSQLKHTAAVLECWVARPEWPQLTVVGTFEAADVREALNAPNVVFQPPVVEGGPAAQQQRITPEHLRRLQVESAVHLCTSESAGFPHYLNEARAVGAVVVATDHPPMNELVTPGSGVLVPPQRLLSYSEQALGRLAPLSGVLAPGALCDAVETALTLGSQVVYARGAAAREQYMYDKAVHLARMQDLRAFLEARAHGLSAMDHRAGLYAHGGALQARPGGVGGRRGGVFAEVPED
ncbi:Art7 [Scenedesmus sp. PABB004]|nr:Art7 [Scenedesmus sp. PABB004]